jgi:hypothetical protein
MNSQDVVFAELNDDDYKPIYTKSTLFRAENNLTFLGLKSLFAEDLYEEYKNINKPIEVSDAYQIMDKYDSLDKEIDPDFYLVRGQFHKKIMSIQDNLIFINLMNKHSIFGSNATLDDLFESLKMVNGDMVEDICFQHNNELMLKSFKKRDKVIDMYFPSISDVKMQSQYSLIEQIESIKIFLRQMFRIIVANKMDVEEDNFDKPISSWFKGAFKKVCGNSPVGNFSAYIAKYLYHTILSQEKFQKDELVVVDLCMGWAGRLTGLMSAMWSKGELSDRKIKFIGTDVNKSLNEGYKRLFNLWSAVINPAMDFECSYSNIPAEEIFSDKQFREVEGKTSMILTSPPYFNKEKYSDDINQSYLRYDKYDVWKEQFLRKLIENSYRLLKVNGEFLLNIANIKQNGSELQLADDALTIAEEVGFKLVNTYSMLFPLTQGLKKNGNIQLPEHRIVKISNVFYKKEPIFRFIKE